MLVRINPNDRLENRSDRLKSQRDKSDLGETEFERFFEQRVERRDQRLDGVVQEMTETQGEQYRHRGLESVGVRQGRPGRGWRGDELCFWHKKSPASFREQGG